MTPNPARRYCVIAALVIVGTFSASSGKLIPYIIPAFPPLAVLLADGIVACAWPDESRPLRSPDSRILMESGPLLGLLGAAVIIAAIEGRVVSHALSRCCCSRSCTRSAESWCSAAR